MLLDIFLSIFDFALEEFEVDISMVKIAGVRNNFSREAARHEATYLTRLERQQPARLMVRWPGTHLQHISRVLF